MAQAFKIPAILAARAADGKKGEDIALIDLSLVSAVAEFMLLVSVGSPAQLEAVEMEIEDALEATGLELLHRDGSRSGLWRVLDFGGILVHLMHPEAREFYALDKLYRDAPRQRWRPRPSGSRAKPPARGKGAAVPAR